MFTQSSKNIFSNINSNQNYLSKRNMAIQILQSLCSKLKLRCQTFYLALYLVDIIFIIKKSYLNLELVSVSCLLLAGNYN